MLVINGIEVARLRESEAIDHRGHLVIVAGRFVAYPFQMQQSADGVQEDRFLDWLVDE